VILKKINKQQVDAHLIRNEVTASKLLCHPNIVRTKTHFEDAQSSYLVLEYCEGTDLFGFMEERDFGLVPEQVLKHIFKQTVEAVHYFHNKGVAHLDLKLENVLIDKNNRVKVIDFGLCEINVNQTTIITRMCGSTDYICPEILASTPFNGFEADIWALGVMLYCMVFGELPFSFKERCRALRRFQPHPSVKFPANRQSASSLQDLLLKMLSVDPLKRPSVDQVLNHQWLQDGSSLTATTAVQQQDADNNASAVPLLHVPEPHRAVSSCALAYLLENASSLFCTSEQQPLTVQ